jgi:autotransporter-associated beta strand protein
MQSLKSLDTISRRLALGTALAAGPLALAAPTTITWDNSAGSTDFEVGTNWVGGSKPADDLTTNIAGFNTAAGMTQPSLTTSRSIAGLNIVNNSTQSLTLGGSDYTLTVGASGITQTLSGGTSSPSTIAPNVTVSGAQTWSIRNTLNLNGVFGGSSAVTLTAPGYLSLNGESSNTYSGTITLNSANGRLYLNKSAGVTALAGDLALGASGGTVTWYTDDQIADTSNITMAAGSLNFYKAATGSTGIGAETFNNLAMSGGTVYSDGAGNLTGTGSGLIQNDATTVTGGTLRVSGGTEWRMASLAISGGGVVNRIGTSYAGTERKLTIGSGGLAITNQAAGAYAPITLGSSVAGKATNKLVLQGDVSFTGYAGNANTTTIAADTANPIRGTVELNGSRTFTIADGDAAVDFRIDPAINDNGATVGGLVKAGPGTLELAGANGYTGATAVSAGKLVVNGSLAAGSAVTVASGATLGGFGTVGSVQVAGSLAPGNSIGTISTGDLGIGNGSGALDVELGRSGGNPVSDLVAVTGTVGIDPDLGSDLKLTLYSGLDNPEVGDIFYLISNDGSDAIAGEFTTLNGTLDLSGGSTFSWNSQDWQITYQANYDGSSFTGGNDLAIQVVPEPAALALLCLGAVGLLRRRGPAVQAILGSCRSRPA